MKYDDVTWENHKKKSKYILQANKHLVELYAPKPKPPADQFDTFSIQLMENTNHPTVESSDFNSTFGCTGWSFYKLINEKKTSSGSIRCHFFFSTLKRFNFDGTKEHFKEILIKLYSDDPSTDKEADYPTSKDSFSEIVINDLTWISYQYGDKKNFRCFLYYTILGDYTLNFSFNSVGILEQGEDYTNFNKPLLDKLIHGFLETVNIYKMGSPEAESLPEPGIYPSKEEMTKDISYTGW